MNKLAKLFAQGCLGICFSVYLTGCACKLKTVVCPVTNMPVNFPTSSRCSKAYYEDAVKTFSPRFKGDIDILNKIKIMSVDFGVDTKVELLKEKLTSDDALMQEVLKSAVLLLQMQPCSGDVAFRKAMDDVANYRIRLETIEADLQKSLNNKIQGVEKVLDLYTQGNTDGKNVGIIAGALDKYYADNGKYPGSLSELTSVNARRAIATLGMAITYKPEPNDIYTLRFAGQDGKLNTDDDKTHRSVKGKPVTE
jgi:hypothetical protein